MRDQIVQRIHDLLDRCGPIPPMYVQDVDVRGAQFLDGCLDRDMEGLYVISGVVHLVSEFILSPLVVGCILRIMSAH